MHNKDHQSIVKYKQRAVCSHFPIYRSYQKRFWSESGPDLEMNDLKSLGFLSQAINTSLDIRHTAATSWVCFMLKQQFVITEPNNQHEKNHCSRKLFRLQLCPKYPLDLDEFIPVCILSLLTAGQLDRWSDLFCSLPRMVVSFLQASFFTVVFFHLPQPSQGLKACFC